MKVQLTPAVHGLETVGLVSSLKSVLLSSGTLENIPFFGQELKGTSLNFKIVKQNRT